MFTPAANQKIWLCTTAVDMRKSFNGLSALVRNKLGHNPQSGQYFVFVNARKTQMMVLYFESSGYCVWAKRLEQGQFPVKNQSNGIQSLTVSGLHMIVDGITVLRHKQAKRYGQSTA